MKMCHCVILKEHKVTITLWAVYVGESAPSHVTIPALSWPLSGHKPSTVNLTSPGFKEENLKKTRLFVQEEINVSSIVLRSEFTAALSFLQD